MPTMRNKHITCVLFACAMFAAPAALAQTWDLHPIVEGIASPSVSVFARPCLAFDPTNLDAATEMPFFAFMDAPSTYHTVQFAAFSYGTGLYERQLVTDLPDSWMNNAIHGLSLAINSEGQPAIALVHQIVTEAPALTARVVFVPPPWPAGTLAGLTAINPPLDGLPGDLSGELYQASEHGLAFRLPCRIELQFDSRNVAHMLLSFNIGVVVEEPEGSGDTHPTTYCSLYYIAYNPATEQGLARKIVPTAAGERLDNNFWDSSLALDGTDRVLVAASRYNDIFYQECTVTYDASDSPVAIACEYSAPLELYGDPQVNSVKNIALVKDPPPGTTVHLGFGIMNYYGSGGDTHHSLMYMRRDGVVDWSPAEEAIEPPPYTAVRTVFSRTWRCTP